MTLLSVQSQGFLWITMLLLFCVIAVHGVKLALIGYRTTRKKLPPEPPKPPKQTPDPVYFLVERKKKRSKREYGEPRKINFQ